MPTTSHSDPAPPRDEQGGGPGPLPPQPPRVVLPTLDEVEAAIEANTAEMKRLRLIRKFLVRIDED
jgi:hypothetical protein